MVFLLAVHADLEVLKITLAEFELSYFENKALRYQLYLILEFLRVIYSYIGFF